MSREAELRELDIAPPRSTATGPSMRSRFPEGAELESLLDLVVDERGGANNLADLFARSLTDPVTNFISRPGKNIRDHLVDLGFSVAARELERNDEPELARAAREVLEIFHAGSLVVDDIEDGSLYRRGEKSLHTVYGVPLALNAGNWLYFLPFKIIEDMSLPRERKSELARQCQTTLLRAHYGQALDLGVSIQSIEQNRVAAVSLAAMELKAGVLTGLALSVGATALGAPPELVKKLDRFGRRLGVALQMFDDIGNMKSSHNPEKRCEDFKLKRLSYVFAVAAQRLEPHHFRELMQLTAALPDSCADLLVALNLHGISFAARREAENFLNQLLDEMRGSLNLKRAESDQLEWLRSRLVGSYE